MVKAETKEIAKYISILVFLSALMLLMFWAVVFSRYGDHIKYNSDLVLSLMLGLAIACYFIALIMTGYMMLKSFVQAKDEELDKLRAKYKKLSGKEI